MKRNLLLLILSVALALKEVQAAFEGEAERLGLKDETEVAAFLKE